MRQLILALSLLTLLILGGCSSLPPVAGGMRVYQSDITLSGRLSVRYTQEGKPQSLQGKFSWQQHGQGINIVLYSPLGQTVAKMTLMPGMATLELPDKGIRQARDVAELTQDLLGWPLPAQGLRYWLQGFLPLASGQLQTMAAEDAATFSSEGWNGRYVSWQQSGTLVYPKRIDLARATASGGDIALRIVIDDYLPQH